MHGWSWLDVGGAIEGAEDFWPKTLVNAGSIQWKTKKVFEGEIKSLFLDTSHLRCLVGIQREVLNRQLVIGRIWSQSRDLGWRNEFVSHWDSR